MKKGMKEIMTLAFVAGTSVVITNLYFMNNYMVYKISDETKKDIFGNVTTYSQEDAEASLRMFDAYEVLKSNYVFGIDSKELIDGAISGMAKATGDEHTKYTPKGKDSEMATNRLKNDYYGIGVEIGFRGDFPTIMSVFEGSPAEGEGLKANDQIIEADGVKYEEQPLAEFVNNISGKEGTKARLTILRDGVEIKREVERRSIKIKTVSHEMKKENIGYIDVDGFYEETAEEFKKALTEIEKNKKMQRLIIDLRDNSGGYLDAAVEMSEHFLKKEQVVVQQESKKETTKFYSSNENAQPKKYEIKILVNENTASSSEIFALALRENLKNVEIVGVETTGKGVVQRVAKMEDGAELKITSAKWLSPKGNWLEEDKKGIKPDREIKQHKLFGAYGFQMIGEEYLEIGDEEEEITYIKALFKETNKDVEVNEKFDEILKEEVRKMQKENGLEETGKIKREEMKIINRKIAEVNKKLKDEQLESLLEGNKQ